MLSDNRVVQGLASLSEFGGPLKHWLQQLLEHPPSEGKPRVLVPLGSRGSLPALWALEAIKGLARFSDFDLEVNRAAFSIENLSEIVSGGQIRDPGWAEARNNSSRDFRAPIYCEIAAWLQRSIDAVSAMGSNAPAIVVDVDEVNTLSNLMERAKIYARIHLPGGSSFHELSLIGSARANVTKTNQLEFSRVRQSWPERLEHDEIVAPSPVSWSDDEVFFDAIGFHYPPIAVPHLNLVTSLVRPTYIGEDGCRKTGYGLFFHEFFRSFGAALAGTDGPDLWLEWYEAESKEKSRLLDRENILRASAQAFLEAVEVCSRHGALKHDPGWQWQSIELNPKRGVVMDASRGKILLNTRFVGLLGRETLYRYPFSIILEKGNPLLDQARRIVSSMIGRIA